MKRTYPVRIKRSGLRTISSSIYKEKKKKTPQMSNNNLFRLPFELVLKITEYLEFSDIWYLGTCSRQCRILSYQILKQHYSIDLIQPRIINPFGHLIHAAVAYLGRYGFQSQVIQPTVLQSVANHMAIAIFDRIPNRTERAISLDFLLDKTLGLLLDHFLHDLTLELSQISKENDEYGENLDEIITSMQQQQPEFIKSVDIYAIKSTGVLMVDFLATLYQTISVLFDTESASDIHHRLLIFHLHRILDGIKHKYHIYHTNLSSYSHNAPMINLNNTHNCSHDFQLFIRFLCALIQTDLLTSKDVEEFTFHHINSFFMTRPSDVSFTTLGGFKIILRNSNANLAIINTATKNKRPAFYYQWKLWLQETQFRLSMLLDLIRATVHKNAPSPPEFKYFTALLQDSVSALTLSQTMEHTTGLEEEEGQIIPVS